MIEQARQTGQATPRAWRPAAAWAVVLALSWQSAADQTAGGEAPDGGMVRRWVEVRDEKGRLPEDLETGDLEIREGESALPLAGLDARTLRSAEPGTARVVLYFDQALSGSLTIKRAAESLAGLARQLVELGEVEIVVADEGPETVLRGRDEILLAERLSRAALTDKGQRRILDIRRRTLRELRPLPAPAPGLSPDEALDIVTAGILEEVELVRARWGQLVDQVFRTRGGGGPRGDDPRGGGPQVLVLVLDGFDLDPIDFYVRQVDESMVRGLARNVASLPALGAGVDELARTLAAAGWTVFPVSFPASEDDPSGIEYSSIESAGETGATGPSQLGGTTSAPGFKIRPGSLFKRERQQAQAPEVIEASLVDPLEPLTRLARETGGEVLRSGAALRDAVERFGDRVAVTWRSGIGEAGTSRSLELRPRNPGWSIRAPRWVARGTPAAVAGFRLRRLLAGYEADGGFDVAAILRLEGTQGGSARLEARLDLRDLEAASADEEWAEREAATLRVSVAIATETGEPRLSSKTFVGEDLRQLDEWTYREELELPAGTTEVAVLVEELHRGNWGGRRATVIEGGLAAGEVGALPGPTVIEVRRPAKELLRGRVRFETDVYDPQVAAVGFVLDDREVERRTRPPFSARIDLGRTPRRRHLTVIAYDRGGLELGRDSVVLNGGSGGLSVDIVRPETLRATGVVVVEADIAVPVERRLDRVLFFWNNQAQATIFAPPFRQRLFIPPDQPAGYIRVVAMLDDGTTAEDVIFMNGPAASDRLEVHLVELYVVVTDAHGRPVRGLTEADFRVSEDGVPQVIATFSDASDLPLTLGMAIDSSASMFIKLPRVQQAAIDFLHSTFSEQDRAFVVDFDTEPRLARATTASLDRIVQSIGSLEASGRTALWESIVFSLVQLQGVRGRKALIVFSDGADEDDHFPFRSSFDIAKKMGVPIYLILMKKEPGERMGWSLFNRSFTSRINRLVEATGGRVFYSKEYDHLGEVYEEIEHELRSQYLLAYYPSEAESSRAWRKVDVDVEGKGLKPRTLAGYWQ